MIEKRLEELGYKFQKELYNLEVARHQKDKQKADDCLVRLALVEYKIIMLEKENHLNGVKFVDNGRKKFRIEKGSINNKETYHEQTEIL